MKNLLLLLLTAFSLSSCKKDGRPNNITSVSGTWKEDFVFDKIYKNNVFIKTDTMPILTSKTTYYTELKNDGQFLSYSLNGATKNDISTGTYTYNATGNLFTQTWASDAAVLSTSPGRVRSNYSYPNASPNSGTQYKVTSIDNNNIVLEVKIPDNIYGAYDGPPVTTTGYAIQIRKLKRN